MNPCKIALLAAVVLPLPVMAGAAADATIDTSRWVCKFCPFEDGRSGSFELGGGYVSDESAKFGEYNGLDSQGGHVVANGEARYRQRNGNWLDLSVRNLGLDTRYLGLQGGKQGGYSLSLQYQELAHSISNTTVTPLAGIGTANLSLPSGWVRAGTTGAMTTLPDSLQRAELATKRKQVTVGGTLISAAHWDYGVKFRHETKTGTMATAGSFAFNSTQLVQAVDYDTDQIDASASYSGRRLQARLAYYGSKFSNNDAALTWSNPYLSGFPGATAGQLAAAPSNDFHQFLASAALRLASRTTASAELALGHMRQDEAFLPATLNPNLAPLVSLPRGSLDGRVDTVSGNVRITSALSDKLRANAAYTYDERDNKTPQAAYAWVTTDALLAQPRTNQPYSSRHTLLRVDATYRLDLGRVPLLKFLHAPRVTAGFDYDTRWRDLQEINDSRESRYWTRVSAQPFTHLDVLFKGTHARREVGAYSANPGISPPENPLLVKYDMADRTRNSAEARIEYTPFARVTLGVGGEFNWDIYNRSTLGLLEAQDDTLNGDVAIVFTDATSATLYLNQQQIKSRQSNVPALPVVPLWFASNRDRIDSAGASLKHRASDRLDFGVNYTVSRSTGQVAVENSTPAFPELYSRLDSARVYWDYRLRQRWMMHLAFWHERFRSANWALDGVGVATLPNVLSLAPGTPTYNVSVVTLSGSREF
jgi:MtrB/PioB family decaheme-associated outer membrane protein